jgi:class 3 adenylate cyclase
LIFNTAIADLFPHTTILFADLAGFTAWSSEREPSQVFTLLETIYRAMDRTAKKLGVFKVETVGDCYGTLIPFFFVLFAAQALTLHLFWL